MYLGCTEIRFPKLPSRAGSPSLLLSLNLVDGIAFNLVDAHRAHARGTSRA
jgi:hypothetical protein